MAQTYTIEVSDLPETLLKRIDKRVKERGGDRNKQVRELLERGLADEESKRSGRSFDEILINIRQGFAESGMSEEEALEMFTSELKIVRANRRAKLNQE